MDTSGIGEPGGGDDGTVDALHRLLRRFRESPIPPPELSDEDLIGEVRGDSGTPAPE
jgi:hypothetical protein